MAKARDRVRRALPRSWSTWPSWFFARGDLAAGGAGDESPLRVRRHDAEGRAEAQLHLRAEPPLRPADARPAAPAGRVGPGPWTVHLTFDTLHKGARHAGRDLAQPARRAARRRRRCPAVRAGGRSAAARVPGPILKTFPLRDSPAAAEVARLQFGVSPDGTPIGPNDFAATGPIKFAIERATTRATSPSCTPTSSSAPIATRSSA